VPALPSTPARLTSPATAKLPRIVLLIVGVVYILAGLFFRDPWKTDDVAGLASMLAIVDGWQPGHWLLPAPAPAADVIPLPGPLASWAGALSIYVLGPLFSLFAGPLDGAIIASRIPNLLWFALMCLSVWYGSYLLGRRPEAQPLALPFGGEPGAPDYGRMIADAALLLIVATVGIIWRMHETSGVPALIAFQALAFYSVARMLDRPAWGAFTLGLALAASFLARGPMGAMPVFLGTLLCWRPGTGLWARRYWLTAALALAATLVLSWWWAAWQATPASAILWWQDQLTGLRVFNPANLAGVLRDLPWFLWPTWPFALLALWRWRQWLHAPHIWVPAMFALMPLLGMFVRDSVFEPEYSLLAVPCAVLASFALPTLRRGVVNSLDWFAVMCFTLTCATVWLGWVALHTGWPAQIARNIARQTAGYEPALSWIPVSIAAVGTLLWLALVRWRLVSRPAALWRGTVLSAGGLIATWLLLATLWMPVLDYVRSYRQVSAELKQVLLARGDVPCVGMLDVGQGQRASFLVFDGIRLSNQAGCPLVLQQTSPAAVRGGRVTTPPGSDVIWQGKRRPDRHEMFRLLQAGEH